MKTLLAALLISLVAVTGADAARYGNDRFGYTIELPAGFSAIHEADNGDGGTAHAAQGDAALSVWGANLLDETFASDVAGRIASDAADGWSISYRTVKPAGASWSGSKGGRILYSHAIPACDGQAAYVRIEYGRAALKTYDPIIRRLVKSLQPTGNCL